MNSVAIKIESGVPLPTRHGSVSNFPFQLMKVGDSFLVGHDRKYAAKNALGTFKKRQPSCRFATRTTDDGFRIWRTA